MIIWTIYDHPTDYPDVYVARKSHIVANVVTATDEVLIDANLIHLREKLVVDKECFDKMDRMPHDAPAILEVWFSREVPVTRH